MRAFTAMISLLALLLWAGGARAAAGNAPPQLLVVADVFEDATQDAQLRADLYDRARRRGYEPATELDVRAAARGAGVMRAGRITTDAAELESFRRALGVALLVRVSREVEGAGGLGIQLHMVSEQGVQTRSLRSAPGAVEATVGEALAQLLGPPVEVEPSPEPPRSSVVAGGLVLEEPPPADRRASQTLREQWDRRGGLVLSYGVSALVTGIQIRNVAFRDRDPSGTEIVGEADAHGIGGGVGLRLAMLYMPIPDPILSQGAFPAVRLGVGVDNNFLYVRTPAGYDFAGSDREVSYDPKALWVMNAMPQLGLHVGMGQFTTETTWRGALAGIAYSPALQYAQDLNETSGDFRFNPAGLELSIDVASIKNEAVAAEPQIRFSILLLAPVDDDRPGLASAGFGATWY